MENVLTGSGDCSAIDATTELGIDSAAEKRAQRHIRDHANAHRFVELLADLPHRIFVRDARPRPLRPAPAVCQ